MNKLQLLGLSAVLSMALSSHADVSVYESFSGITEGQALEAYNGGTGFNGNWSAYSVSGTGRSVAGQAWTGIDGGHSPNSDGTNQQWFGRTGADWNAGAASRSLAAENHIDLGQDQTFYMSFFARSGNKNNIFHFGLSGTDNNDSQGKDLFFGNAYAGDNTRGLTAYFGDSGASYQANADGTGLPGQNNAFRTRFFVAEIVKTNSGVTDDLTINMIAYDLDSTSGVIDDAAEYVTWLRTINATGVDATMTDVFFALDGRENHYVSIDEMRIGDTWGDVTGVVPEPSSYALIAGCLGFASVVLRRRR